MGKYGWYIGGNMLASEGAVTGRQAWPSNPDEEGSIAAAHELKFMFMFMIGANEGIGGG